MYIDSIRAYVPQDAQEAADRAMILDYIARFPDILTRNNPIAHISSSGFVVNADASKVLMAHHNIFRVWAWTGGHADGETDLLSVALREAREETGAVHILPLSAEIASVDRGTPSGPARERTPRWRGWTRRGCWKLPMSGRWITYIPSSWTGPARC